jgi:hypothetical protein
MMMYKLFCIFWVDGGKREFMVYSNVIALVLVAEFECDAQTLTTVGCKDSGICQ